MRQLRIVAVLGFLLVSVSWAQSGRDLLVSLSAAEALLRGGDALPAIELLTALEGDAARDPQLLALLGRARVLNREFAAAEPLLERAAASGYADFGTLLTLGAVLWENGKLDLAEARYRQAVAVAGGDPVGVYALAKLLLWRGDAEAAVPLFSKVREQRAGWLEVCLEYARALEQTDALEPALEQIAAFVEGNPEHAGALYTLARIYDRLGRRAEARDALGRFVAATTEDRQRALEQGRQASALDGVREALSSGEPEAALERLRALPETIASLLLAARAFELAGDPTAVLRVLEQAVAIDPSRADVRVELQEAYRRLGVGG